MTGSAKRIAGFSLIAAISVIAVACGESKVSQCNKLIEVANKAVGDVQEVTSSANPEDVNAMIKIADTADQAKATMETLEINDEQLQSFQQRFVAMYQETSTATRSLVDAVGKQDNQAAETAYNSLQAATDQETPLVNEVNEYCMVN